ncbi:MAG: c-type cytochrome biogenesis protein CcmF, partial [Gluconobacter oxydans]
MFGPEQGHFALALACVLALVQFAVPLWGANRRDARLVGLAPYLAVSQLIALGYSFLCLIMCAVSDDFSVQNVAANSAVSKPLLYK